MSGGKGMAFLSGLIASSYNPNCYEEEDDYPNSIVRFSAIEFETPIEVVITLGQIGAAIHEVAKVPFRIEADVYGKAFSQSSRIYIRDAHSLFEMLEMFTVTAGLKWRISVDGAVEVYREKSDGLMDEVAEIIQSIGLPELAGQR